MRNEPSTPAEEKIQALLATYQVEATSLAFERTIGEGAFAKVDLVSLGSTSAQDARPAHTEQHRQRQLAKPGATLAAVKRFKPSVMNDATLRRLVLNEAELLHQLKHPFIVRALGVGCTDMTSPATMLQTFFLLQEYVPGHNLRKLVTRSMIHPGGCYKRRDAIRWARQLASALAYLHSRVPRVMHRDVKLDNVLLTSTDPAVADIRLVDFGLGVQLPGYAIQEAHTAHNMTAKRSAQEAAWSRSMTSISQPRGLVDVLVGSVRRGAVMDSSRGKDKSHNNTSRSWAGSFRPFRRLEPQLPPQPEQASLPVVTDTLLLQPDSSSKDTVAAATTEGGSRHRGGNQSAAAVAAAKAVVTVAATTEPAVACDASVPALTEDLSLGPPANLSHAVSAPIGSLSFRELMDEQASAGGGPTAGLSLHLANMHDTDHSLEFSLPLPPMADTPRLFSATSAPAGFDVGYCNVQQPSSRRSSTEILGTASSSDSHDPLGLGSPAKSGFRRSPFHLASHAGQDQGGMSASSFGFMSSRGPTNMKTLSTLPTVSEGVGPGGASPPALSTRSSNSSSSTQVSSDGAQQAADTVEEQQQPAAEQGTYADADLADTCQHSDILQPLLQRTQGIPHGEELHPTGWQVVQGYQDTKGTLPGQHEVNSLQPDAAATEQHGTIVAPSLGLGLDVAPGLKPIALRRQASLGLAPLGAGTSTAESHAGSVISSAGSTAGSTVGVASAGTGAGSVTERCVDLSACTTWMPEADTQHSIDPTTRTHVALSLPRRHASATGVSGGKSRLMCSHSDAAGEPNSQPLASASPAAAAAAAATASNSLQRTASGRLLPRLLAKAIRRSQSHNVANSTAHAALLQPSPATHLESYADYVLHARTTEADSALQTPILDVNALAQRVLFTTLDVEPDTAVDSASTLNQDVSANGSVKAPWQGLHKDLLLPGAGFKDPASPSHDAMAFQHSVKMTGNGASELPSSVVTLPTAGTAAGLSQSCETTHLVVPNSCQSPEGVTAGPTAMTCIKDQPLQDDMAVQGGSGQSAAGGSDHLNNNNILEPVTSDQASNITTADHTTVDKVHPTMQHVATNGSCQYDASQHAVEPTPKPAASVVGSQLRTSSSFPSGLLQHPFNDRAAQPGDSSSHHWSGRSKCTVGSPGKTGGPETSGRFANFKASFRPQRPVIDKNQTFDMTRGTGSLMYMAPEVFKGLPYNQKADVFSFGMCLYELLHFQLQLVALLETSGGKEPQAAIHEYAAAVAAGYRPPLSHALPESLCDLIQRCWSTNPLERPNMEAVVGTLAAINTDQLEQLDAMDRAAAGTCSCCTIC